MLNEKIKMNVPDSADARKWERFAANKPALLISVNQGLHGTATRKCQVVDISMGGAGLQVITTVGLPDHYYLCIIGIDDERIGVAEVHRSGDKIGVRFIKPLTEYFLNRILRA
ncbi:MAG: pilZ domain protein [Rhizobium sp.]|nr:pilZ domain protein [Rhizobium sp.]